MRLGALPSLAAKQVLGLVLLPGLVVLVQRGSKTPSFAPPSLGLTFCTTCTGVAPGMHQPPFAGLSACIDGVYALVARLVLGANAGADFRLIGVVQVLKKRWCCTTRAKVLCANNSEASENPGNPWVPPPVGGRSAFLTSYSDNLSVSRAVEPPARGSVLAVEQPPAPARTTPSHSASPISVGQTPRAVWREPSGRPGPAEACWLTHSFIASSSIGHSRGSANSWPRRSAS